jgi:nucleoside 2-deoxyribosyltransferase
MRKVYLAGPMSNRPYFNFPAFHEATRHLREQGFEVFSPAECDVERVVANGGDPDWWKSCHKGSHDEIVAAGITNTLNYKDCMRVDLNWIIDNADVIAMLPEWEKSKGAVAEKALADCLGLKVMYL